MDEGIGGRRLAIGIRLGLDLIENPVFMIIDLHEASTFLFLGKDK